MISSSALELRQPPLNREENWRNYDEQMLWVNFETRSSYSLTLTI